VEDVFVLANGCLKIGVTDLFSKANRIFLLNHNRSFCSPLSVCSFGGDINFDIDPRYFICFGSYICRPGLLTKDVQKLQ